MRGIGLYLLHVANPAFSKNKENGLDYGGIERVTSSSVLPQFASLDVKRSVDVGELSG